VLQELSSIEINAMASDRNMKFSSRLAMTTSPLGLPRE